MFLEKREDFEKDMMIDDGAIEIVQKFSKRLKLFALLAIIFAFVISAGILFLSKKHQAKLTEQMEQQAAQIERQNQLIEALIDKENTKNKKSIPVITTETLKSQINSLQELVTQEYIYTNADQRNADEKWFFGWKRPFSDSSLLIIYDGTIKAGIDLSEVQIDVNEENRKITITLPASKITDNNIPQDSIMVVDVRDGLGNKITFDDYNEFISEQKIIMENKAIEHGILKKATEEAKKALEAFLAPIPGMTGEDAYTLEIKQ